MGSLWSVKGWFGIITNTMAVSLSDTPITVNAVSPGWIQVGDYELSEKENTLYDMF